MVKIPLFLYKDEDYGNRSLYKPISAMSPIRKGLLDSQDSFLYNVGLKQADSYVAQPHF